MRKLLVLITSEKLFAFGIVMRALLGLTVGANSSIGPMCLVEVAPKDITGFFGNLNQFGIVIGIIWMYLQGNWHIWQSLCITGIVINAAQAGLIWLVPETGAPKSKEEEDDAGEAQKESESLWQKKYIGKLLVGVMMMVIQQLAGVNALITNLDQNFQDVGVSIPSGIASAISVAAQLIAVFISGLLVDAIGRRPLFCASALGCAVFLVIFALNDWFKWTNWLPIVCIFLYMFCFGAALGPVPWFVIPELFPDSVRALASSLISSSNWICAFIVIFVYPPLRDAIGNNWTLVIFACIAAAGSVYGWFYITEPPKDGEVLDWDAGEKAEDDPQPEL